MQHYIKSTKQESDDQSAQHPSKMLFILMIGLPREKHVCVLMWSQFLNFHGKNKRGPIRPRIKQTVFTSVWWITLSTALCLCPTRFVSPLHINCFSKDLLFFLFFFFVEETQ